MSLSRPFTRPSPESSKKRPDRTGGNFRNRFGGQFWCDIRGEIPRSDPPWLFGSLLFPRPQIALPPPARKSYLPLEYTNRAEVCQASRNSILWKCVDVNEKLIGFRPYKNCQLEKSPSINDALIFPTSSLRKNDQRHQVHRVMSIPPESARMCEFRRPRSQNGLLYPSP